jgi:hypothetical protein
MEEQVGAPRPQSAGLPGDEVPLVVAASAQRGWWLVSGASRVAPGATTRVGERCRRDRNGERTHGEHHRTDTPNPRHWGVSLPCPQTPWLTAPFDGY